jgi:hypothetical protein
LDPNDEIFAEHVDRPELLPGQDWVEFMGVRGRTRDEDPEPEEAFAFYERCVAVVECWDVLNRSFVFFPPGGMRIRKKDRPWKTHMDRVAFIRESPSRGEIPRSHGWPFGASAE